MHSNYFSRTATTAISPLKGLIGDVAVCVIAINIENSFFLASEFLAGKRKKRINSGIYPLKWRILVKGHARNFK